MAKEITNATAVRETEADVKLRANVQKYLKKREGVELSRNEVYLKAMRALHYQLFAK